MNNRLLIEVTGTDHGFHATIPGTEHRGFGATIPAALRSLGEAIVDTREFLRVNCRTHDYDAVMDYLLYYQQGHRRTTTP